MGGLRTVRFRPLAHQSGRAASDPVVDGKSLTYLMVVSSQRGPLRQQPGRNASDPRNLISGMLAAWPYIAGTALIGLPIMAIAGEGDYIIAIMAVLFAGLFLFGWRKRRSGEKGTFERSHGFWIAFYSFMLAVVCAAIATALLFEPGGWRYLG